MIADVDTYTSVLTSRAHLFAELTIELGTSFVIYPFLRWAVRRHDRKEHSVNEKNACVLCNEEKDSWGIVVGTGGKATINDVIIGPGYYCSPCLNKL